MTQEEKQLLLVDLCGRLPYGVKGVHILGTTIWSEEPETIVDIDLPEEKIWTNDTVQGYNIEEQDFKPYLRPRSSMTEDEKEELSCYENDIQRADFYYSHHIDCRFMIEKGLALVAPEGMYNTK